MWSVERQTGDGKKRSLGTNLNNDMQLTLKSESICASKGLKLASATSLENRPTLRCSNYSLILQTQDSSYKKITEKQQRKAPKCTNIE